MKIKNQLPREQKVGNFLLYLQAFEQNSAMGSSFCLAFPAPFAVFRFLFFSLLVSLSSRDAGILKGLPEEENMETVNQGKQNQHFLSK